MEINDYITQLASSINSYIHYNLPEEKGDVEKLYSSMRYSALNGGKRLRPVLVLMINEIFKGNTKEALPAAMAIELIHTYSLIHDDLPAMDDGQFRRGKPSNHRVFGEDLAILAGDALLTYAFEILAKHATDPVLTLTLIHELAQAAGSEGMIGGQILDIGSGIPIEDRTTLERLHYMKTGALFRCACRMGGMTARADDKYIQLLSDFGIRFGLLFQITDDILDEEGDPILMGKSTGKDRELNKLTFVSLLGKEQAKKEAEALAQSIIRYCAKLPNSRRLVELVEMVRTRNN